MKGRGGQRFYTICLFNSSVGPGLCMMYIYIFDTRLIIIFFGARFIRGFFLECGMWDVNRRDLKGATGHFRNLDRSRNIAMIVNRAPHS